MNNQQPIEIPEEVKQHAIAVQQRANELKQNLAQNIYHASKSVQKNIPSHFQVFTEWSVAHIAELQVVADAISNRCNALDAAIRKLVDLLDSNADTETEADPLP